ncbi:HAMP domain-containing sensor histidine kinase [Lutispora thermophila]|uniref:histidine kinase n=1 Tax=Lutispora thermophila DSM 19022 TaxID=1122184 RepID=A0A1M6GND4_9FIRM|nr:HAMP domain-containing sensor histidine kinase [Lutispora thermophila]SHJ11448.1 Signal transduction histidine kinase [Lutispora thermophila DSM 19022]
MFRMCETKYTEIKHCKIIMAEGILLLFAGYAYPFLTQQFWFRIIIMIREAINTGDSGHLILASATNNSLYAVQSTLIFMGNIFIIFYFANKYKLDRYNILLISMIMNIAFHWFSYLTFKICWEPISTILALLVTLFLVDRTFNETNSFVQVFIVSIQVFFGFYWLNIMPLFSSYGLGQSESLYSIKNAGIYLNSEIVLNFVGIAFFLPFVISAFITATLFISFSHNISVMKDNYEKESKLKDMRAKALENRIYQEVKSLIHDLKTPLVTIRGLNSLILSCKEQGKLAEYSQRIENSVMKMSEMISGFLYETSRQRLKVSELVNYIRAQLPLEDENIKFHIEIEEGLPEIYINKIRIARAVINILENAINVPSAYQFKLIKFLVKSADKGISIIIEDNGIGIKEGDLLKIWEVGYSTNNTSGLGLPFAKAIIEDNGGSIEISSVIGEGTKVIVFLPQFNDINEQND